MDKHYHVNDASNHFARSRPALFRFKKLTTSCAYLNQGYIIVNDEWYQFQNSDAPAGKELQVTVPIKIQESSVDAGDCCFNEQETGSTTTTTNQLNVVIFTTMREGNSQNWKCIQNYDSSKEGVYLQQSFLSSAKKKLNFNNLFRGTKPAAKIKDTSYAGTTRIEFSFEDLHNINPQQADYDYTDYNFEISVPDWVSFNFGDVSFGPKR